MWFHKWYMTAMKLPVKQVTCDLDSEKDTGDFFRCIFQPLNFPSLWQFYSQAYNSQSPYYSNVCVCVCTICKHGTWLLYTNGFFYFILFYFIFLNFLRDTKSNFRVICLFCRVYYGIVFSLLVENWTAILSYDLYIYIIIELCRERFVGCSPYDFLRWHFSSP